MTETNQYTVQRIDENTWELWFDGNLLQTLTREEAWSVMLGQVQPEDLIRDEDKQTVERGDNTRGQ